MNRYTFLLLIIGMCISSSCKTQADQSIWTIPVAEVFDGGPGKDGIPAIDAPDFTKASEVDFLDDFDLVLAIQVNDEVRAYPHPILDWHEIINDDIQNTSVAVTYCPLTGTGVGWDRNIDGQNTTFGVSGLLFNSNLIPYDRKTDSNWSQIRMDCVNGELINEVVATHFLVELPFGLFKEMYPNAMVVNTNTGHSRDYDRYPYDDYKINNNKLLFSVSHDDDRLPQKERVLALMEGDKAKAFAFSLFPGSEPTILYETFQNESILVVGAENRNYIVAYRRETSDGTLLEVTPVLNDLPAIMQDQQGNKWDIFGVAIEGPRKGERLPELRAFIGYWFSFGTFYPGLELVR